MLAQKLYTLGRNHTLNFGVRAPPGLVICSSVLSGGVGGQSRSSRSATLSRGETTRDGQRTDRRSVSLPRRGTQCITRATQRFPVQQALWEADGSERGQAPWAREVQFQSLVFSACEGLLKPKPCQKLKRVCV